MSRPAHSRSAGVEARGRGMGSGPQQKAHQGRLAVQHRERAGEAQEVVPRTMNDSGDWACWIPPSATIARPSRQYLEINQIIRSHIAISHPLLLSATRSAVL